MIQKPPHRRRNAPIRLRICTSCLLSEAIPRHRPCLSWKEAIAGPENHRPLFQGLMPERPGLTPGQADFPQVQKSASHWNFLFGTFIQPAHIHPLRDGPNIHNNHPKELLSMPRDTHERDAKKKIHHHDEYQQPAMKFPFRIFKTPSFEDQPESITAPQLNVASL